MTQRDNSYILTQMGDSGKNIFQKALGSRVFLFFSLLISIFLAVSIGREGYRKHQLGQEQSRVKKEIEQFEKRNNYLSELMNYFNDETYLEEQARVKLNFKKPDENVVIIERPQDKNGASEKKQGSGAGLPAAGPEEATNYWKWWEYFFGQ